MEILTQNYFYKTVWNYLRPIDKIVLSRVCTQLREIYKIDINKLIMEKLLGVRSHSIFIFNKLQQGKCVVSGSILLQFLYDEDWKSSVDIFLLHKDLGYVEFDEYLDKNGYREIYAYHPWMAYVPFLLSHVCNLGWRDTVGTYEISFLKYTGRDVDCPNFDRIEDVIDYFSDLSVCKILYDGEKLRIKHLEDIIKRMTYSNDCHALCRNSVMGKKWAYSAEDRRVIKYRNRGFTISHR